MANKRLQQLYVARETQPGVAASGLVAIGNAKIRVKDPVMTPAVDIYEREILYGSLDALTPLVGKVEMDLSFSVELAGSTVAATAPVWAPLMEACGFRMATIYGGSWSGGMTGTASGIAKSARHGEQWQTAAAAKVIKIVHDTFVSGTPSTDSRMLFYEVITGTPATSDVFYPSTSDGTVGPLITLTGGSPGTACGFAFYPVSTASISCTISTAGGTNVLGDIYQGQTSRCTLQSLVAVTATTGVKFRILDGIPSAGGETLSNLTQGGTVVIDSTPVYAQVDIPTLSFGLNQEGRVLVMTGSRGTVKLSGEKGKPAFLEFRFKGALGALQVSGVLSGVSFESPAPPRLLGTGFLLASHKSGETGYFRQDNMVTPSVESFAFDIGSEANLEEDITQTTGTLGIAQITSVRKAQGSMKIGTKVEQNWPVVTKLVNSQPFGIKARIVDPDSTAATRNSFLLSSPGCKATGLNPTDTNNLMRDDISFTMSGLFPNGTELSDRLLVLSYHHTGTVNW